MADNLMGATHPIITKKLGEGGTKYGDEVKFIQQLLARVGFNPVNNTDGSWGNSSGPNLSNTHKAWIKYQESKGWTAKPYIEPTDPEDRLGALADDANVTIPITAGLRSQTGAGYMYAFCLGYGLPYGWEDVKKGKVYGGGTKVIWGFENRPGKLLFTGVRKTGFPATGEARSLNCTSFANLMLAAWTQGSAHHAPYDASQMVGGYGPYLGDRYAMPMIRNKAGLRVFADLQEIKDTLQKDRIYHVAWASRATGETTHDMVSYNGMVYQANTPAAAGSQIAVYERTLDALWAGRDSSKGLRIWGPGPF
jgi:hypothetical protein